jgi:hypothetical protein
MGSAGQGISLQLLIRSVNMGLVRLFDVKGRRINSDDSLR